MSFSILGKAFKTSTWVMNPRWRPFSIRAAIVASFEVSCLFFLASVRTSVFLADFVECGDLAGFDFGLVFGFGAGFLDGFDGFFVFFDVAIGIMRKN
jgi:hypothetical protein